MNSFLKTLKAGMLMLCVCSVPRIAAAQTMQWTDKGYVSVNGGVQVGSHSLNTSSTFSLYDENATVTTSQKVKGGGFFDIGGAYRVWGHNLLAGITFVHTGSDSNVSVHASVPDPRFFDQPRTVDTSQSGSKHSENVVHLDAVWMIPVADKLDVGVFAGPSIFAVKQDTVTTFTVTEPTPTVTAPLTRVSKTTGGVNFGADLQYMVHKKIAVGGVARFSWGSAKIDGATKSLTVGGFELGVGARYRF